LTGLILISVGRERPTAEVVLSKAIPLIGPVKFTGPIADFPLQWILWKFFSLTIPEFTLSIDARRLISIQRKKAVIGKKGNRHFQSISGSAPYSGAKMRGTLPDWPITGM
jgi:hypothetical protein